MKFAIIALLGVTSAASLKGMHSDCCCEQKVCDPCASGAYGNRYASYGRGSGSGYGSSGVSATLPGAERAGAYAKLTAESAGSQTQIGAQNIVIPDKHTVTDQAKVSEAQSNGQAQSQKCSLSERTFDICGSITVAESYNDKTKSEHCASKNGEGASQSRSRTQVQNNLCARADIPCTCASGSGSAGYAGKGCNCGCC